MDKTTTKALVVGGSAVAGGALGRWAGSRLATSYGMNMGPWGIVAGALLGLLAGSVLSDSIQAESENGDQPEE